MGRVADRDGHRRRRGLQAGGDVDCVAGEEALAARRIHVETHESLAGVDADADLRPLPADARQRVDLVDQAEAGADGALGVVLVERGNTEDRHHSVTDVLLHDPAVGLDGLAGDGVVAAKEGVDNLSVVALGECGEADQVAEQRGDDAALLERRGGSGCSRLEPAIGAPRSTLGSRVVEGWSVRAESTTRPRSPQRDREDCVPLTPQPVCGAFAE